MDGNGSGSWVGCGLIGLVGLIGLFIASRATDAPFAVGGWLMALGAITFIFTRIKAHFDRIDSAGHG